jgi:hypothetical protein
MTEGSGWYEWSAAINGHIEKLQENRRTANKRLAEIEKFLFRLRPDNEEMTLENCTLIDIIRMYALEMVFERKIMRDTGVWDEARLYAPGATVTFQGAAWVCQEQHEGQRPGASNSFWRLAVKSDVSELRRIVRDEVRKALSTAGESRG